MDNLVLFLGTFVQDYSIVALIDEQSSIESKHTDIKS